MNVYTEWRYWLFGVGWRTAKQALIGWWVTLYFGPWRFSFFPMERHMETDSPSFQYLDELPAKVWAARPQEGGESR